MTRTAAVPVSELKVFRKIIQREANVIMASYTTPGEKTLSDTTPVFIMREYLEMRRAEKVIDDLLVKAGAR